MADIPFTVFSFLGFILCIPPAYFNWKIPGRPWATLIFIGWICVLNGLSFIDSIVWGSSNPDGWWDGKVYCDIDSRIKSEFQIGLPAAGIGICRFLADATNPDPSQTDLKRTRFRRNMIDLFLGIGLPLINMGLKMFVNPTRYYIMGVSGCTGVTDLSLPSIFLYHIWCPVLSTIAAIYASIPPPFLIIVNVVIFIRNWWIRRKRLNAEWALGNRNGISKTEFRRLQFTVLSVLCFYFPFSFFVFASTLKLHRIPYSWKRIHGPMWWIIIKFAMPNANLGMWIGPCLAVTSFIFIGTTRNARNFYERCVEWTYDHSPQKLRARLSGMRKISETCKERRKAGIRGTYANGQDGSMVEMYVIPKMYSNSSKPNRGRAVKNWFDSEDDTDDLTSIQSSHTTLAGRDDKEGAIPFSANGTTTEVFAGLGVAPDVTHGIVVRQQVIVETSSR